MSSQVRLVKVNQSHSTTTQSWVQRRLMLQQTGFFFSLKHPFALKSSTLWIRFCLDPLQALSPSPRPALTLPFVPSHLFWNLTKLHFLAHQSSSHSSDLPVHARRWTVRPPCQQSKAFCWWPDKETKVLRLQLPWEQSCVHGKKFFKKSLLSHKKLVVKYLTVDSIETFECNIFYQRHLKASCGFFMVTYVNTPNYACSP